MPVGNEFRRSDLVPLQEQRLEQVAATMPEIGPLTPAIMPTMPTARALEVLRHELAAKKSMPDVAPARAPETRRLELTAARSGAEPGFRERPSLRESWRGTVGVDGEFGYGDLLSMKFQGDFVDLRRPGGDDDEGEFWFAETGIDSWEENAVNDARISFGLFNDRFRLILRRAWSRYSGSKSYLREEDDGEEGKGRFLDHGRADGSAVLHRLDAEVLKWGEADLSMFARYQKVDPFFQYLTLSDDDGHDASGEEAPFATPNEEVVEFGTTVGLGPVKLTLSRSSVREIIGDLGDDDEDEDDVSQELRHEASLLLSLEDVRDRLGDRVPKGLWTPLPDSLWVSIAEGRVEKGGDSDGPDDGTGDISFGLSWSWSGGYADLSYWRSLYDSRGPFVEEYDWNGDGLDLTFGLDGKTWSLGAALGANRSEDEATASRSTDLGIDGSLWLTLQPKGLPDIAVGASFGRYGTEYVAYDEASRTDAWELSVKLDFSKYLVDPEAEDQPRLKMLYRFEGDRTRDGFTGASGGANHTMAASLQMKF